LEAAWGLSLVAALIAVSGFPLADSRMT